jgi:hypothetical protein
MQEPEFFFVFIFAPDAFACVFNTCCTFGISSEDFRIIVISSVYAVTDVADYPRPICIPGNVACKALRMGFMTIA